MKKRRYFSQENDIVWKEGKAEKTKARKIECLERQITSLNLSVEYQSSKQVNERIFTILKKQS